MADALIIKIAEAAKNSLNDAAFDHEFTATREYVTDWERETGGLRVVVVPVSETLTFEARDNVTQHNYVIEIGVQDDSAPNDLNKLDRIFGLMDAIVDHLRSTKLIEGLTVVGIGRDPVFDQDHLLEHHQLRLTATFTYRGLRAA